MGMKNMRRHKVEVETMSASLTIPEGKVIVTLPKAISVQSAEKISMWLRVASQLEGVEILPQDHHKEV